MYGYYSLLLEVEKVINAQSQYIKYLNKRIDRLERVVDQKKFINDFKRKKIKTKN